jgi:HEAT repeat protein
VIKLTDMQEINLRLENPDWQVRITAVQSLERAGEMGIAEAIDKLLEMLDDSAWQVRHATLEALGNLKEKRAVEPLVKHLDDENWRIRQGAAFALGYIGDERAVPCLLKKLQFDEDWRVRQAAAASFKSMKDKRALPVLLDALGDSEWHIKCQAAETLGELEDVTALPHLEKARQGADPRARQIIDKAIKKIRIANDPDAKVSGDVEVTIPREKVVEMKKQSGSGCREINPYGNHQDNGK